MSVMRDAIPRSPSIAPALYAGSFSSFAPPGRRFSAFVLWARGVGRLPLRCPPSACGRFDPRVRRVVCCPECHSGLADRAAPPARSQGGCSISFFVFQGDIIARSRMSISPALHAGYHSLYAVHFSGFLPRTFCY